MQDNTLKECYEAYGVETEKHTLYKCSYGQSGLGLCPLYGENENCINTCDKKKYTEEIYPTLTAEKVLELIKTISRTRFCNYLGFKNSVTKFYCQVLSFGTPERITGEGDSFTQALLSLLTKLQPEFNEAECKQVRTIIER
jgi:hypothetical protein